MRLIRKHTKDKSVKNMTAGIDVPALKSSCCNASLYIEHQSTLTLKQLRAEVRFTHAGVHLGIIRCHTNNHHSLGLQDEAQFRVKLGLVRVRSWVIQYISWM